MKEKEEPESEQLLPKPSNGDKTAIPVLRARIAAAFIPIFSLSAGSARDSLMPQFLVQRLAEDAGFSNGTDYSSCIDDTNNSAINTANDLQAQASEQMMYYSLTLSVIAFFTCLLVGSYTDYVGRRLLILLPVLTNFIMTSIICCVIKFHLDLRFIYMAYAIDGIAGSWYTMFLALFSFTADINSAKKERTFWIYFLGCTSSITAAVINVAIGQLISSHGFFEACLLLCCMMFVAFIVPLIFLPETLQNRRSIKGVNPLKHGRKMIGFYLLDGSLRQRATFCVCLLLFVAAVANDLNIGSLDALYQMHSPFCWSSVQIGNYSAIRTAGGHFLGMIYFRLLQMRVSSERIGMLGALFQCGALVFEAFIGVPWQLYLVPVILIPSCPMVFIVRSMFSILAGPDHQGAVFSSIAVVETLVNLASSQLYNRVYSATVSYMPGAVYLVMAGVSCLACIMFGVYFAVRERPQTQETIEPEKPANGELSQEKTAL